MLNNNSIILFDGVCNLCNSSVQFILKHEQDKKLKFASLQSKFGQNILIVNGLNSTGFDTIVFIENKKIFLKSKAIFAISKYLKFPYCSIKIFKILPIYLTDFFYDIISKNRYTYFGKKGTCYLPSKELTDRFY